jgi:Leucine-rich repeat (LRR) protein
MKIIPSSRRNHCIARVGTFLIAVALIAGMVSCGEVTPPAQYNLTMAVTPSGSGIVTDLTNASPYVAGTNVSIKAVANSGYRFVNWTASADGLADTNAAQTTFTMPAQNATVTANFEAIATVKYSLTVSSDTEGSVTTPGEGTFMYSAGTIVNIVASPNSGYQFTNWTGNVDTISNVNLASTTITVNGNYSIKANFEQVPPVRYSLTITSNGGGSVTLPGQGTFTYDAGTVVSMVATPAGGYQFSGWTGDTATLSCACQSTTITMNGDYSIMANFSGIPVTYYTLTVAVNGSSSISPSVGQHTYAAGTLVSITATPASCCSFANWSGNVGSIGNVSAASTTIRMSGDYSITANFAQGEAVYFPDPNLEAVVREAIGKTTGLICASELEGLTNLYAGQGSIFNLTGLEHCTNLTYLDVRFNQISDISPLDNLSNLTGLWLSGNQISDVSSLANLTKLRELDLGANQISDISSLANLTKLREVGLGGNQISDISPLANLTNLTSLTLMDNQLSNISPLANLTNLGYLYLYSNQISEVWSLANLTNLRYLILNSNQISDVSPLANLTSLYELHLASNQIGDISSLANLTSLTWLILMGNQISDISPLTNLTNLTWLNLGDNQISDVSPLTNLTSLTGLPLYDNQISDVSPLANLTNLRYLYLETNQISDISSLANLTSLTCLNLQDNQISDISALVQNEGLSTGDLVDLHSNPLSSDSINIYIPQLQTRGVTVYY